MKPTEDRIWEVRFRFEKEWRTWVRDGMKGDPPAVEHHLPACESDGCDGLTCAATDHPYPIHFLVGLLLADQHWRALKARPTPSVLDDYLPRFPALTRPCCDACRAQIVDLFVCDFDRLKAEAEIPPEPEEYLQRVPDALCKPLLGRLRRGLRADFELRGLIARGGIGDVHEALDRQFGRTVALKRLLPEYSAHGGAQHHFRQESEITAALEHPGIVPVFRMVVDDEGRPGYTMRLIRRDDPSSPFEDLADAITRFHSRRGLPGGGLRARRRLMAHALRCLRADGRRPSGRLVRWLDRSRARLGRRPGFDGPEFRGLLEHFRRACDAVAYAHSRQIVHRDLKPDNVITGPFGETFVLDWGLAKDVDLSGVPAAAGSSATRVGETKGTPAYMSPEQAGGETSRIDHRADVYGLGATLYHLLTGQAPFPGRDVDSILQRVRRGEFSPPRSIVPTVPRPLEAISRKAMALRAEGRYQSVEALRDEVGRWLADERVQADTREPWYERTGRWARKHKPTVAGAAVFLFALLAASITFSLLDRHLRANAAVDRLLTALPAEVPLALKDVRQSRPWGEYRLRMAGRVGQRRRWRPLLALWPADAGGRKAICDALISAETEVPSAEFLVLYDQLKADPGPLRADLWEAFANTSSSEVKFRAACALAGFDPENPRWKDQEGPILEFVAAQLVARPLILAGDYAKALRPVADRLVPRLRAVYTNRDRLPGERQVALDILASYSVDPRDRDATGRRLCELLTESDPEHSGIVWGYLEAGNHLQTAEAEFRSILAGADSPDSEPSGADKDAAARRRAKAGAALARLKALDAVTPKFAQAKDPRLRTYLVHYLHPMKADAAALVRSLSSESDSSVHQAIILGLGMWDPGTKDFDVRGLVDRLVGLYENDPDPGVHAAARWTLTRWSDLGAPGIAAALEAADARLDGLTFEARGTRRWFRSAHYRGHDAHTLAIIPRPPSRSFDMGDWDGYWKDAKPDDVVRPNPGLPEPERLQVAESHRIDRDERGWRAPLAVDFAIATTETTRAQFAAFARDQRIPWDSSPSSYFPDARCPAGALPWFFAVRYCNWLTLREFGPSELCYTIPEGEDRQRQLSERGPDGLLVPDHLPKRGYRLPTEAEWEYACRAGTVTPRYYGLDLALLPLYAAYLGNSPERTLPVGSLIPNRFGLFDTLGNVAEWCDFTPGTWQAEHPRPLWEYRPVRGGSYFSKGSFVRAEYRISFHYGVTRNNNFGFRIARSLTPGRKSP